jgi:uncharacterized integral membrane protein
MTAKPAGRASRRDHLGTGLYASVIGAFVVAVAIVVGIIQNMQTVEVKYLSWDVRTPLIVVLLVTILATLMVAGLVGIAWRRRMRRRLAERAELLELRRTRDAAASASAAAAPAAETPPPPPYPGAGGSSRA